MTATPESSRENDSLTSLVQRGRFGTLVGHADVLRGRRMCLCGMLAAEYQTLPKPMRDAVLRFFDENEVWLAKVASEGRDAGTCTWQQSTGRCRYQVSAARHECVAHPTAGYRG